MSSWNMVLPISYSFFRFPVVCQGKSGSREAVLKFFTKTNNETKKIKKRCFFASVEERSQSRYASEKYSFRSGAEKRKIFPEATRRA